MIGALALAFFYGVMFDRVAFGVPTREQPPPYTDPLLQPPPYNAPAPQREKSQEPWLPHTM